MSVRVLLSYFAARQSAYLLRVHSRQAIDIGNSQVGKCGRVVSSVTVMGWSQTGCRLEGGRVYIGLLIASRQSRTDNNTRAQGSGERADNGSELEDGSNPVLTVEIPKRLGQAWAWAARHQAEGTGTANCEIGACMGKDKMA